MVKQYKRETRAVVRRFVHHQLSFANCISHLDAALARFIPRMRSEDVDALRTVMLTNNEKVMDEMGKRGRAG